jgi:predicted glycoside hydrolase/deacetylase ChbG (UPF0249 family)
MAIKEIAESGIAFSTSVMVTCPWFTEAVEMLRQYHHVSTGVHLTLNAEWKGYRWGPVLGAAAVPSLVDSLGYFFPTRDAFMANNPNLNEVERELRAQIQKALNAGLKPSYVDYHMGTAVNTPELRAIVEKLASEFKLGISRYFGEQDAPSMYKVPYNQKVDSLVFNISQLENGKRWLLVCHIGLETPEMDALTDLNTFGLPEMSKHRNAERKALLSDKFRDALKTKNAKLLTYSDIIKSEGLKSMKRPMLH